MEWLAIDRFEAATSLILERRCLVLAQELAGQVQRDFKVPAFTLERVDHNAVRELRLQSIAKTLTDVGSGQPLLDTFFVWSSAGRSLGSDSMFFYRLNAPTLPSTESGAGFVQDDELSRLVLERSRDFAAIHANFALTQVDYGARRFEVVYHLLYDVPERRHLLSMLGFLIDSRRVRTKYLPDVVHAVVHSRNFSEAQLFGFPAPLVSIINERGEDVYDSGGRPPAQCVGHVRFPYVFYDADVIDSLAPFRPMVRYWSVCTGYQRGDVTNIARLQTLHQRVLWLVVAFVAVGGLVLGTRAAVREIRMAELKSDFVASVSHDLKTPLAKIQLFADTLKSGRVKSPAKLQEYLAIVSAQTSKLDRQIADILDFSRIEAGRSEYEMEEIDVRAVLASTLATFRDELTQEGFRVELDLPEAEFPVKGSADGLRHVFENLISNAIKYSDGDRFLGVELSRTDGRVEIAFRDHGVGVSKRDQAKIFEKFYRSGQPKSKTIAGSGLGLAIVRDIVTAHGGRVTVRSTPGVGSTFVVELPFSDEQAREV